MKIAFFGTGEFSKTILENLIKIKDIEIKIVISQIDKPIGRKMEIMPTPVKQLALENGLEILQPQKLKDEDFINHLKTLNLDFIIVVAYGKILPVSVLEIPKYHSINIHGSILPAYRGASPIQESIKNGDSKTGITIMEMSAGMDEGDIFDIYEVDILQNDKSDDIFRKFGDIGATKLYEVLNKIIAGSIKKIPQDSSKAIYCTKILKENGQIDFEKESLKNIYNKFRAYYSWPGIYTYYKGKKLDIIDCEIEENDLVFDEDFHLGDVIEFEDHGQNHIGILCIGGILILNKVKLEGKKENNIKDFLNGNKDFLDYNFITPNP